MPVLSPAVIEMVCSSAEAKDEALAAAAEAARLAQIAAEEEAARLEAELAAAEEGYYHTIQ